MPRTVIIISQIIAVDIDHKTLNIIPRTDQNIVVTNRSHHNSQNRSHNRQHKYNTKINEIDDLSDCSPDCSDRSDCEDYCTDYKTQEVEDPKTEYPL